MFGTQIYIGEPDAVTKEQQPELIYLQDAHNLGEDLYPVDHVIRDGDTLHFGDLTIQCRLVPGHTKGCVALFFPVTENERTVRAGYYGGFGFNTLTKAYLREIGDTTYSMRQIYLQSLRSVMDEPVDLFLGNHTDNNHVLEKRATSYCAAPICLTASGGTAPGISSRCCHFCWGSSRRSASTAISSTRRRCTGGR